MAGMDHILEEAVAIQKERELGQTSLFEVFEPESTTSPTGSTWSRPLQKIEEWSQSQLLQYERQLTGFYITAHPLTQHAEAIRLLSTHNTGNLNEAPEGKEVKIFGVIGNIKNTTTKKGDRMAYVQIEDLQGLVEIIVFPELYKNSEQLFKNLKNKDWILHYINWERMLIKELGFEANIKNEIFDQNKKMSKSNIFSALDYNKNLLFSYFFTPNKIAFSFERRCLENYYKN
mgnify:CR=1 FL=1